MLSNKDSKSGKLGKGSWFKSGKSLIFPKYIFFITFNYCYDSLRFLRWQMKHVGLASKQKCKVAKLIRLGQMNFVDTSARKINIILQIEFHNKLLVFNLKKIQMNRTCWIHIKVSNYTLIHIEYRWKSFQVANGQVWEKSHLFKFKLCHWWKCVFKICSFKYSFLWQPQCFEMIQKRVGQSNWCESKQKCKEAVVIRLGCYYS